MGKRTMFGARSRARAMIATLCVGLIGGLGVAGHADPAVTWELASGVIGGLGGAALAVISIETVIPGLESRVARTAMVLGSVTVLAGTGAAVGVLVAGRLLDVQGKVPACFAGAIAGGFASMWIEPLLYALRVPEAITEFLGMLMLPIGPAIGATIGFNRPFGEALSSGD